MPETASSNAVVVIGIDSASLDQHGTWRWPRKQLATVVENLRQFHPKVIGLRLPLNTTETPAAIEALSAELQDLEPPLRRQARSWLSGLDTDAQLAHTMEKAGNVVLLAPPGAQVNGTGTENGLKPFTLQTVNADPSWQQALLRILLSPPQTPPAGIESPLPAFLHSAVHVGVGAMYKQKQRISSVPLAVKAGGAYLPGFELAVLAAANDRSTLIIDPGHGVRIGNERFITAPDLSYYPRPASPVPAYTLQQLNRDDSLGNKLRDRIVILGATLQKLSPKLRAPAGQHYNPVTWSAHVVDSLLGGSAFLVPQWFYGAWRALLLIFTLYLVALPADWHQLRAPIVTGVLAMLSLNTGLLALTVHQLWLPVTGPVVFLLATQLLLWFISRRRSLLANAQQQLVEARVALGKQLQSQGQLELAMEQFSPCLPAPLALDSVYQLGLEHERRRQVHKAQAIYARLSAGAKGYRDAAQRSRRLAELSKRFPGADAPAANSTLILDDPVMELPVLGRYQLERELGRGAMGTVYLATDPTIGRQVAIKTLPLLDQYAAREQQAVAQRFLQEAEAVGRLAHPNIVNIHDAGQEHDLAYITMDYVEGSSLDAWVNESALLPVWEVLDLAAQVADALDYAHGRKVVHRDIKPGNIIYDRDSGTVKITDFGVARILDNKRTRTGTVLGTPSYMSPEQVAGQKIDGQSDLFSLGATLFQLLTGCLPFSGDSVATLMYQIANQKTPALRKYRRGLPVCVSRLVNRALQKAPAKRFTSGAEMALAVRKCRAQFKGGRRKSA
jgi:serine/threonine-protein kinase